MARLDHRIHDRRAVSGRRDLADWIDADRVRPAGAHQMTRLPLVVLATLPLCAQPPQELARQGEQIFNKTCATGYCHTLKGGSGGGAPRLSARGFDEQYI